MPGLHHDTVAPFQNAYQDTTTEKGKNTQAQRGAAALRRRAGNVVSCLSYDGVCPGGVPPPQCESRLQLGPGSEVYLIVAELLRKTTTTTKKSFDLILNLVPLGVLAVARSADDEE